jgi:hypothetical protein
VSSLESGIDALYRGLLDDFVSSRTALVKTLTGTEAKRVKALVKPTVVPWAVNQVYWHARSVFDRVRASGITLRDAQLAALAGRSADIRRASDVHRAELAKAVAEATRQAAAVGLKPDADALSQTFEAISVAPATSEMDGRLTKPLRPAGFEALAHAVVKPRMPDDAVSGRRGGETRDARRDHERETRARKEERARLADERQQARRHAAAIEKAKRALDQATEAEERARDVLGQRTREREAAEKMLDRLQHS